MKSFQDNLRELMNERNFTQKSLAEKSGVPSSSIASWLGKQASLPNIEAAAKIASALGCSVDYLLDRETDDASVVISSGSPLTQDEVRIMGLYRRLNRRQKEAAFNFLSGMLAV